MGKKLSEMSVKELEAMLWSGNKIKWIIRLVDGCLVGCLICFYLLVILCSMGGA